MTTMMITTTNPLAVRPSSHLEASRLDVLAEEIRRHETEAQAHADRTAQHRQRRQVDAHGRERQQQADEGEQRTHAIGRVEEVLVEGSVVD